MELMCFAFNVLWSDFFFFFLVLMDLAFKVHFEIQIGS